MEQAVAVREKGNVADGEEKSKGGQLTMDKPWKQYDKNYKKTEYSIFTDDGEIHSPCWPNAGTFHVMGKDFQVPEDRVLAVKECTAGDFNINEESKS